LQARDAVTVYLNIPIVTPLVLATGYDLVWWGIVNLMVLETGLITPPFGIHLFVLNVQRNYRGVIIAFMWWRERPCSGARPPWRIA